MSIGFEEARDWNELAALSHVTSADDTSNGTKGGNGKRRNWNLTFSIPDSNQKYIIQIINGKIHRTREVTGSKENIDKLIDQNEVTIDSPEIIRIANDKLNLKPGKHWTEGFHYIIRKNENRTYINLVALDQDGLNVRVFIDAKTGEIFDVLKKVPSGGGLYAISLAEINLYFNCYFIFILIC